VKNDHVTGEDIRYIAFYLPQFHPIPENDQNWGKGFTDWLNVAKALPQFVGHYQPHLPDELGFYDLRMPSVQKQQIEIAKNYGIYGFCFHFYWFNGKRLLEKPLDQFLNDPGMDFPFCLCWANENWTRRWDGAEDKILIAQNHSLENDFAVIRDMEPYLRDPRYIRIDGRPVLIVYRVPLLYDALSITKKWREYCVERGIGDPYLVAAETFGFREPSRYGFDAAVEFPPHIMPGCPNLTGHLKFLNRQFEGDVWDLARFVKNGRYLDKRPYTLFKAACPAWDNTPRRPNSASVFHGSTPEIFREWLSAISRHTIMNNGRSEQIVFINAWNEWAEGAHLEPDRKYGYAFLEKVHECLLEYRELGSDGK